MSSSNDNPIRRSQLIRPYGVGALYTQKNDTGVITCGLDHWYKKEGKETPDISEFEINIEWRLQRQLGVSHFRSPPEYRDKSFLTSEVDLNSGLAIPFLRFPQWHFCPSCRNMKKLSTKNRGKQPCDFCSEKSRSIGKRFSNNLIQVPIVMVCENGHIEDFPWSQWCHRSHSNSCGENYLRFEYSGKPGIAGQSVYCGKCNTRRSLQGIFSRERFQSQVTNDDERFRCSGLSPWHNHIEKSIGDKACDSELLVSLRGSNNVYFSVLESSIYVPENINEVPERLKNLIHSPIIKTIIDVQVASGLEPKKVLMDALEKKNYKQFIEFSEFNKSSIDLAIQNYLDQNEEIKESNELSQTEFRAPEYNLFKTNFSSEELRSQTVEIDDFKEIVSKYISKVSLIKKLTKTEALCGFTRIRSGVNLRKRELKHLMWQEEPNFENSWLPAMQVSGEGIFLEFDEQKIKKMEKNKLVVERVLKLRSSISGPWIDEEKINARFIFLHTFSHILMNTLIFECGYGASALQERVYSSVDNKNPMAGILIYTAGGSNEATMGGLVRMGLPGQLEKIFEKAISSSSWCSVDPVCMEASERGGQGPFSVNLAACHNCALVPETSCESFNSYLDRALVTGTIKDKSLGFFADEL
ncbi:DUF1998 domain-containing protein [Alphaproteobacteria bacterium]|nr:DUF1998 domain-containing protein [Alphaproteobacteria bacterium]